MLTFFRTNSIFQFIVACLLFLLSRIIIINDDVPNLIPGLRQFLVAEGLGNSKILYKNLIVGIDPLFAFFSRFFYSIFRRHELSYEVLASILAIFEAWYFSKIVAQRFLLKEKSFLPAFIFFLCLTLSFDQIKLGSGLISNLFLLLALNSLIKQFEFSIITDSIFEVGLYIGIAFVFQFSCIFFLVWAILMAVFYTSISVRQIFLVFFGFAVPFLFVLAYFYFNNATDDFKEDWIFTIYRFNFPSKSEILGLSYAFTVPLIIGFLGFINIFRSSRYSNYQNKIHQILFFQFLFSVPAGMFNYYIAPGEVTFIIPSLAFFISAYFVKSSNKWYSEIIFLLFVSTCGFLFFKSTKNNVFGTYSHLEYLKINQKEVIEKYQNKPIFVTGNHLSYYQNSRLATAYIDWDLSEKDFKNLNNYENLLRIYTRLAANPPEYIIDEAGVMSKVFKRLPDFSAKYEKLDKKSYHLKKSN